MIITMTLTTCGTVLVEFSNPDWELAYKRVVAHLTNMARAQVENKR